MATLCQTMRFTEGARVHHADELSGQTRWKMRNFKCMKPAITIEYCPKCHWLLRAAYMAQEILTTFEEDVHSVTLVPSATGGQFTIHVNEALVFDRKEYGGFPEIRELKQRARDMVHPGKDLGHIDKR